MTLVGTLWGDARQRQTKVILSIAALNNFELNQPAFSFDDKPAEFAEKFPYGKIPSFESTTGFKLIEGTPIARYLSSIGKVDLLGSNNEDAALVDQWVHYAEHEIFIPVLGISAQINNFFTSFSREMVDKNKERLLRALDYLESHLETCPSGHVALGRLTLADLVLASLVYTAARLTLGVSERKQYPRIFAHYDKVTRDEKIRQYWGTDGFVDVAITEPRTRS